MNFFIYMHGGPLFFCRVFVTVIALALFLVLTIWMTKRFKLSDKASTYFVFAVSPCILFGSIFGTGLLLDPYNQGVVRELFIFDEGREPRLTVWLTRFHSKRYGGADYDQRLKTFELESGRTLGMVEMQRKHHASDYRLYWSSGNKKAWGFSKSTGAQHLSLTEPSVHAVTANIPHPKPPLRGGWPSRRKQLTEPGWSFRRAKDSLGYHALGPEGKLSAESAIFLEPNRIEALCRREETKERIWIAHQSAFHGDYCQLLSYVDTSGREINRINLTELCGRASIKAHSRYKTRNKEMIKAVATYTRDKEIMVFITRGENFLSSNSGFTLTALRVDRATGKILDTIDFIN